MKKFSTEEITNIISNETNIWEQFKQNMKRWEKKLEVYGINIKLEQYWENNIYDPGEYSRAAEPPVQCGVSHLSRRTEPHCL